MSTIHSIPKIYRFGERWTNGILDGPVVIEEKYDGSQFTFGVVDGLLICRSKSTIIDRSAPGMFNHATATAERLQDAGFLQEGWIYLCEYLAKVKHNVLNYERTPKNNLVLYDVLTGPRAPVPNSWLSPGGKFEMANILGLEPVRILGNGHVNPVEHGAYFAKLMAEESSLGKCKVEGIVIKNYGHPHGERGDGWPQTAKIVSEAFKERQSLKPHKVARQGDEIIVRLVDALRTEARWLKAVQHLREAGALDHASTDIGKLCKEAQRDVLEEEADWIKNKLFEEFSREIAKGVVQGFAQWYQGKLANGWSVFEETEISGKVPNITGTPDRETNAGEPPRTSPGLEQSEVLSGVIGGANPPLAAI